MHFDVVWDNRDFLLQGLRTTVAISALGILFSLALGVVVGAVRTYARAPFTWVCALYVDVIRSIPFLVILVWLFFVPPLLIGVGVSPFWTGVLALGLHGGAYLAEIFRAGLTSIRQGQRRAGLALGMTRLTVVRRIVLPQAVIRMLPPTGTYSGGIINKSAIASVIAVEELTRQAQLLSSVTIRPFEIFMVVMVAYSLLVYGVVRGVEAIYQRLAPLGAS